MRRHTRARGRTARQGTARGQCCFLLPVSCIRRGQHRTPMPLPLPLPPDSGTGTSYLGTARRGSRAHIIESRAAARAQNNSRGGGGDDDHVVDAPFARRNWAPLRAAPRRGTLGGVTVPGATSSSQANHTQYAYCSAPHNGLHSILFFMARMQTVVVY